MNSDAMTIKQAAPQIFRRPALCVSVNDELVHAATLMAIGPQIFVDGLVVTDDNGSRIMGRLGNQHIMYHILKSGGSWLDTKLSELFDSKAHTLDALSELGQALDVFEETRFAFVPIAIAGKLVASLSLRDLLLLLSAAQIKTTLKDISSSLIALDSNCSVGDAIRTFTDRRIRNVGIRMGNEKDPVRIINDRKVLEFLVSHEGRQTLSAGSGIEGLDRIPIDTLQLLEPKRVPGDVTISAAASLLRDVGTPCILSDDAIITPWDLVIKGMAHSARK